MYRNFENLPEDKRNKIISVSIEEFAQNGYEKASTNSIVKKAGISKGILFHYFGNKKSLYLYILDYVIDYYIKKFNSQYAFSTSDVFERLVERAKEKMKLAYEDPDMYKLVFEAFANTPDDIKPEVQGRYAKIIAEQTPLAFKDLDFSKFRKGVDPKKAIELIVLSLEALGNKYLSMYKNRGIWTSEEMEKMMQESLEYVEMLKYGIYESEK
ncbi:MAG: TetR/AcrR family transcriptional regulator [Clostridia bacterium]|nr:TetR/AcrR family transcriptional regulator [Clostridia bacterium]